MFVFDSDKLKYLIQELREKFVLQTDFNDLEKIETSATEPNNNEISIWINTSEDTLIDKLARINDNIMSSDVTWSSLKISNEYATKEDVQNAIDNLELDNQEIDLSEYAKKTDVPTNISELNNDEEFITIESVPTNISELNNDRGFITITSIPTKVSQLLNDSEFTTIDNVPISVSELINDKGFITIADVPTKTSQLTNDSNFLTQHQDLSNYATIDDLPSRTSQLTNDSGYITRQYVDNALDNLEIPNSDGNNSVNTNVDLSAYATKEYVDNAIDEIDVTEQLGDYALKTDIPTVPTKISQLTNDSNFITSIPSEYITDSELNAKSYATENYVTNAINNAQLGGGDSSSVDLSVYALKTELHNHTNKTVIDAITNDNLTKWNKSLPFEDSYVADANAWLTNGYTKTSTSTTNLPSLCTGSDRWGVLFFIAENATNGTGTQVYYPIDGTYVGRVFVRSIKNRNPNGNWTVLSTFDGDYNNLTNKPTIPTVTNDLTNTLKSNYDSAYTHSTSAHAPSNAQKNSDITKAEIEAKLTGSITTHTHNYLTSVPSEYITETELNAKNYATTSQIPTSLPANGGNADTVGGFTIWTGTQAQYDAITTKSSTTLYFIKEG